MGKKPKIRPTEVEGRSDSIRATKIDDTAKVSFNFRRLNNKGGKFQYIEKDSSYFLKLLERLRDVSGMSRKEMTIQNYKSLRCHKIDFKDKGVSEETFGVIGQDVDEDAWQFQLTSNEHGRVHGYFVENTFYVVWLDPEHQLYNGKQD